MALDEHGRILERTPSPATKEELQAVKDFFAVAGIVATDRQATEAYASFCSMFANAYRRAVVQRMVPPYVLKA